MQMAQFGQYNGSMPGQGQHWQQGPGLMGSSGFGQPDPGLFSGGGALAPQNASEQPRPAPKESTFDFVGVGHLPHACPVKLCHIDLHMPAPGGAQSIPGVAADLTFSLTDVRS
jgi:hypothetical protein